MRESELQQQCKEFIDLLKAAAASGTIDVRATSWGPVREFLTEISRSRALQGATPVQTATFVFSLKRPLFDRLRAEAADNADLLADPKRRFRAGGESTTRDLNIVIGDSVKAGRLLLGFTRSQQGNWTSWPPHEHTKMLEEVYVYFDMPPPAFGIQLVYDNPARPEFAAVVHDGDAVLMPSGYHPNVAAPGHSINFIWMMAAHREVEDRQFGVVNV